MPPTAHFSEVHAAISTLPDVVLPPGAFVAKPNQHPFGVETLDPLSILKMIYVNEERGKSSHTCSFLSSTRSGGVMRFSGIMTLMLHKLSDMFSI